MCDAPRGTTTQENRSECTRQPYSVRGRGPWPTSQRCVRPWEGLRAGKGMIATTRLRGSSRSRRGCPCGSPWLLALQLLQFRVDRAQTPLTGHVLPPPHDEGASQAAGPPLATGGVLQIGEPSMDELQHRGPPSPLSGPHGWVVISM